MHCADIARELAVPTGAVAAAEVERHLAACPQCADRAEAERRFDRLWDATRPAEPPASTFADLWARVTAAAEAPAVHGAPSAEAPAVLAFADPQAGAMGRGRLRRWGAVVALVAVAQAASILLTALVVSRLATTPENAVGQPGIEVATVTNTPPPGRPSAPTIGAGETAVAQVFSFELDEGQTLIFQLDESNDHVVVRPRLIEMDDLIAFDGETAEPIALAGAVQADLILLNAMEALDGLALRYDVPAPDDAEPAPAAEVGPPGAAARPTGRPAPYGLAVPLLVGLLPIGDPVGLDVARVGPPRQVTVFGILARPDDDAVDPMLDAMVVDELHKFMPGHGFLLRGVTSRRLDTGGRVDCDLGEDIVARAELVDALDPATGKLRIRFALELDGRTTFATDVTTPPNQLFFCEKPLGDGTRLLIGIGAR